MPHDSERLDNPARWLSNAKSDLAIAGIDLPFGGLYEQLCFHTQQAAEKSIKAVLLKIGIEFPFTHNLQALIDLLPSELHSELVDEAVNLNPYAVATRYPGEIEPVTEDDYQDALRIAKAVYEWADYIVNSF